MDTRSHVCYKAEYEQQCANIARQSEAKLEELDFLSSPPLPPASVAIGRYTHAQHHRDGLFSEVFKVKRPEDESGRDTGSLALKVTTPSMMVAPHNSEREARILGDARSNFVLPLIDTFWFSGSRFVLVFPFMPMDFQEALASGKLSAAQSKSYMKDMFSALHFIHSKGLIHRDVKPSNLLLKSASGPAYLADFGIAWCPSDKASEPADQKITDVGTTCYRPPELLFGNSSYNTSLDLWAAGCVLAEGATLTTKTLFDSGELGSDLALIMSIFSSLGTPNTDIWPEAATLPDWGKMSFKEFAPQPWPELVPNVSIDALDLISKLIVYQSTARLTAKSVLRHPFFSETP